MIKPLPIQSQGEGEAEDIIQRFVVPEFMNNLSFEEQVYVCSAMIDFASKLKGVMFTHSIKELTNQTNKEDN